MFRSFLRTVTVLVLVLSAAAPQRADAAAFTRGDASADGTFNITDVIFTLDFLFLGTVERLDCDDAADVDDDGLLTITDPIFTLGFLFLGESPPPAPFPGCGSDPTEDPLDCRAFDDCPQEGPPVASFIAEPLAGPVPLTVTFDASPSRDPGDGPLSFEWEFGDGAVEEGGLVEHTYLDPGRFEATLTVTDAEGNTAVATAEIAAVDLSTDTTVEGFVVTVNPTFVVADPADAPAGSLPASGARIRLTVVESTYSGLIPPVDTFTGDDGSFRFEDTATGLLRLDVFLDPGADPDAADPDATTLLTAVESTVVPVNGSFAIDRDEALERASALFPEKALVYQSQNPLPSGANVVAARDLVMELDDGAPVPGPPAAPVRILPAQEWLFYADAEPFTFQAHEARYVFVDATDGAVTSIDGFLGEPVVNSTFLWTDLGRGDTPSQRPELVLPWLPDVVRFPQFDEVDLALREELRGKGAGAGDVPVAGRPEDIFIVYVSGAIDLGTDQGAANASAFFQDAGVPEDNFLLVRTIETRPFVPRPGGGQAPAVVLALERHNETIARRLEEGRTSTLVLWYEGHSCTGGGLCVHHRPDEPGEARRSVRIDPRLWIGPLIVTEACRVHIVFDTCFAEEAMRVALPPLLDRPYVLKLYAAADVVTTAKFYKHAFPVLFDAGGTYSNKFRANTTVADGDLVVDIENVEGGVLGFRQNPMHVFRDPSRTDSDGDGLTDFEERCTHLTDPDDIDTDSDRLPDGDEVARGTDPRSPDTDGDGFEDGLEVDSDSDPLDPDDDPGDRDLDGDGLTNREEQALRTDPRNPDSDGDGVRDGDEVNGQPATDPTLPDTDGDDLSDGEERTLGTDPTALDTDGDLLFDGVEVDLGTDPRNPDTDGDGRTDGEEARGAVTSNPLVPDTDGDGLDDRREVDIGTDPKKVDTDDDGLTDPVEIETTNTSPTIADSDFGGIPDGAEVNVFGTDPNNPADDRLIIDEDDDGDGLSNGEEVNDLGTHPRDPDTDDDGLEDGAEIAVGTDPFDADTDDGGASDGGEVDFGLDPLDPADDDGLLDDDSDGLLNIEEERLGTDPDDPDSDTDGLTDGAEVNVHSTDPLDRDTDGDGASDGQEVADGTDPLVAEGDDDEIRFEIVQLTDTVGAFNCCASVNSSGRIVFTSNGDLTGENGTGEFQGFIIDADRTGMRQLARATGDGIPFGRLAARSDLIVFGARDTEGRSDLFVMRADGTGARRITSLDTQFFDVSIDSLGEVVASQCTIPNPPNFGGEAEKICLARGDGSGSALLTPPEPAQFCCPSITAGRVVDGASLGPTRVAFATEKSLTGGAASVSFEIHIAEIGTDLDPQSAQFRRLTLTPFPDKQDKFGADISEDGSTVAFIVPENRLVGGNVLLRSQVRVASAESRDGSDVRALTEPGRTSGFEHQAGDPTVSGDGERIAFPFNGDPTGDNADGNLELFLSVVGRTELVQLTSSTGGESTLPRLDPTARFLAFQSTADLTGENPDGNTEIFVIVFAD